MANMEKTRIRLNAVAIRLARKVRFHGSKEQIKYIKNTIECRRLDVELRKIERSLIKDFGGDWRFNQICKETSDYKLYFDVLVKQMKLNERNSKLEDKYSFDGDEVMRLHVADNINSTSF